MATALVKAASALVILMIGRRPATELTPSCPEEQSGESDEPGEARLWASARAPGPRFLVSSIPPGNCPAGRHVGLLGPDGDATLFLFEDGVLSDQVTGPVM